VAIKTNRSVPQATVIPVLIYPDVREAVAWLTEAFGFAERVRIGENHRSQLRFGDGAVIVGDVRGDRHPPSAGKVTHSVMVRVEYGERQYSAEDPFGHQWTFTETRADVAPEDWGGETVEG
jgi:uncharacterized glyoxalase superfamily protein PhnB